MADKKYSKKLASFICEKIEGGMTLSDVCRKYPDKVPVRRTILRWQEKNEEFKEKMDFAYQCWMQSKLDRLTYVSTAPRLELYPDLDAKDAYEARRAEMDALKFMLAKMGDRMTKRWAVTQKVEVEHKGDVGPKFLIMNYAPEVKDEKIVNSIEHKDEDK